MIYWRKFGKKLSMKSWESESKKTRTVEKIGYFESKNLFTTFFWTPGVVNISYLDKGNAIDSQRSAKRSAFDSKRLFKTSCYYF